MIKFLLSDAPEAISLRDKFIFKIIPMLNPDGVVYGNYRSSMLGVDLNRRWKNPSKFLHPTIYYSKSLIKWLMTLDVSGSDKGSGNVVLTCDFHGHSRKNNVFMYGCVSQSTVDGVSLAQNQLMHLVPDAISQICPIFSVKDCKFALEREKETTARIVLFKELGIINSYTLETTFFKSDLAAKKAANPELTKRQQTYQQVSQTMVSGSFVGVPSQSTAWVNLDQRPDAQITA